MVENRNRINDYLNSLKERTRNSPIGMMEFNETIRYPQGLLYLHINKVHGIELPDNTFIRITFDPYIVETRTLNKTKHGDEFHQRFYLPIHNHFNELIIDILFVENEGWFREKRKETLIASIEIPNPSINSMISKEGSHTLRFPFKIESKKLHADIAKGKYNKGVDKTQKSEGSKDIKIKDVILTEEEFEEDKYLEIDVYDFTSLTSLYEFHLNRNRCENRVMGDSYSLKKYQEVIWRLKLCTLAIEKFKNAQRFIFYHNYPRFSLFLEIFMVVFVYFFNAEHLLIYGLLALILCLVYNSGLLNDHVINIFFLEEMRNPMIRDTDIKNQFFVDEELTKVRLKEEKGLIDEKSNFYNIKRRGILGRYNQFKQKSAKTLDKLEYVVDVFEKFKNLL